MMFRLFFLMAKAKLRRFQLSGKSPAARLGFSLLIGFSFLYLMAIFGFMLYMIRKGAVSLGADFASVPVGVGLVVTMLFAVLQGLVIMMGEVFVAKDAAFLASLPIPQRKVFTAKLLWVLVIGYIFSLFTFVPTVVVGALGSALRWDYILKVVLVFAVLPVIPTLIGVLPALLLMRLSRFFRRRELFTTIAAFVGFVILMLVYILGVSKFTATFGNLAAMGKLVSGILSQVTLAFPPAAWAASAICSSNIHSWALLLIYIGVSLLAAGLVVMVSGNLYQKAALSTAESAAKKSRKNIKLSEEQQNPLKAIIKKEWRLLFRSPMFALNSFAGILMGPLIVLIFKMMPSTGSKGGSLILLMSSLSTIADNYWGWMGMAAYMVFIAGLHPAAATCVSREGAAFSFVKSLPVAPSTHARAKSICNLTIAAVAVLLVSIALVIGIQLPVSSVYLSAIIAISATWSITNFSIMVDFWRPKLKWDNEQEAIKQNMNVLIGMAVAMVVAGLFGGVAWGLLQIFKTPILAWAGLVVVGIGLGLFSQRMLTKVAEKTWPKIEG